MDLAAAVPKGTVITPDESSWRPASPRTGTIRIEVERPGKPGVPMLAVMVLEHGTWRLLGTYPIGDR